MFVAKAPRPSMAWRFGVQGRYRINEGYGLYAYHICLLVHYEQYHMYYECFRSIRLAGDRVSFQLGQGNNPQIQTDNPTTKQRKSYKSHQNLINIACVHHIKPRLPTQIMLDDHYTEVRIC